MNERLLFIQPFFLLFFLPTVVGIFYLVRIYFGRTAALAVIALASAVFYLPYGALAFALLSTSLCVNLIIAGALSALEDHRERQRKPLLTIGLLLNFANLATFKYFDQIIAMADPTSQPLLGVAIPAGISFYTFHQAVFLVHAYNRQAEVVAFLKGKTGVFGRSAVFIRYAAFVAFFPQLVIGPITYMGEFWPQIERLGFGRLRKANLQVGLTLVIAGLFKKIVIADNLANLANPLFHNVAFGTPITREQAVLAIASYFFQLYFDFSGYSDMAVGIARLFGLRLPMNFDSPLRATGIIDFYRRWHMTLTRVIVLFVFTPLSLWGTRFAMARGIRGWRGRLLGAWIPFLVNFQIIALWHSAKYTFIAFGLIHGIWYVLETELRASKAFRRFKSGSSDGFRTLAGMAITVVPLALTFALFRSPDLHAFQALLQAIVGEGAQPSFDAGHINRRIWLGVAAVAFVVYALPNNYELLRHYRPAIRTFENKSMLLAQFRLAWRPNLAWGLFVGALAVLAIIGLNVPTPFLYAGF